MANNNHFSLTLDTTAPSATIARSAQFCKAQQTLNITGSGEPSHMKLWFTTSSSGSKSDTGYTDGSWVTFATTATTNFTTDGTYYYHIVVKDDVGNESEVANTESIIFDTAVPTISGAYAQDPDSSSKTITNNLINNIHFAFADNLSGVTSGTISCSDFASTYNLTLSGTSGTYDDQVAFKDGTADGTKTITIKVKDAAGNESVATTVNITLDMSIATPVLVLLTESETSLPNYINYRAIKANLTSTDTDIVAYKIWESGTTEPDYTTRTSGTALNVTESITLSDSDGTKTICAKVKDSAGSEKSAADKSVVLDRVAPVVTISRTGSEYISNVTGYTSSTIQFSVSDALSGIASYTVKCNGSTISSGTAEKTDETITVTSATTGMVEGENKFTVTATDNAGNSSTTDSGAIVRLDTTVPSGSLPNLNTWYNDTFGITGITYSDTGAGVHGIYVWSDSSSTATTTVPSGCSEVTPATSSVTAAQIKFDLTQSASNYMHLVVKDNVGNLYAAGVKTFGYDNVAPTGSVTFSQAVYTSTTASINLSMTDATSGKSQTSPYAQYVKVTGNITDPDEDYVTLTSTRSVTLTAGDGNKTVNVSFKDAAGNVSATTYSATCELDTSTPSGTLSLYERGTTTTKASPSNIATADAYITYSDDTIGNGYYKIWGGYHYYDASAEDHRGTQLAATEDAASWIEITPEAGVKAFTVNLVCTTGDGQKNLSVRLKDNAGHLYPASSENPLTVNFVYDTAGINVNAGNPDYNRISKVNIQRIGADTGKMCDEIHFSFFADDGTGKASSEEFQAYKVVAYIDQAAAIAGTYADAAIPTTAGSTNTSASGISQTGAVDVMIKGADFESALNGGAGAVTTHEFDGTHIVVVYMQDAAGTWSESAKFDA